MIKVNLPKKFTSIHLNSIINEYWEITMNSEVHEQIIFDLSELEWIAVEEIVFLFAWIRKLVSSKKLVKFKLADFGKWLHELDIDTIIAKNTNFFKQNNWLNEILKQVKVPPKIRTSINLWHRWEMRKCFLPNNIFDHYIHDSNIINTFLKVEEVKDLKRMADGRSYSIIPFKILENDSDQTIKSIRSHLKSKLSSIYNIEKEVNDILNEEGCANPFDNRTLSNIITVELFLNSMMHSFSENEILKESYLGISVTHKQNPEKYKNDLLAKGQIKDLDEAAEYIQNRINSNFINEKSQSELDYFKGDDKNFRNESFINFTYLDFGKGIVETLRPQFQKDQEKEFVLNQMTQKDLGSEDSKIIEYSFLLHSSKNPVLINIEKQEFVPRGLYFVIEYVKRYKGLLVAKSSFGKVVYNFKDPDRLIKECLVHEEFHAEKSFFPGTLITIVIPSGVQVSVKGLENESNNKSVRRQLESGVPFKNKFSMEVVKIEHIFRKIIKTDPLLLIEKINGETTGKLYNHLFVAINEYLIANDNLSRLLIFDFENLEKNFLDAKLYYFICQNPLVNKLNNVIIINPPDRNILIEIQGLFLSNEYDNIKTVPAILSHHEVIWIGIKDLEFEKKLNETWIFDSKPSYTQNDDFNSRIPSAKDCIEGNIIRFDSRGNLQDFSIPHLDQLFDYLNEHEQQFVSALIQDEANKILLKSEYLENGVYRNRIFETSGNYYQERFLSYLGKFMDREDISSTYHISTIERFANILLDRLIKKKGSLETMGATKIVAVTLSSHILAEEIRDICNTHISNKNKKNLLELIKLTNYFEFENEDSFNFNVNDKVIIVNDVISTGSLNEKLYNSIMAKGAMVIAIFSISDTRQLQNENPVVPHSYNQWIDDNLLICIHKESIRKFSKKEEIEGYNDSFKIVKVNSVLNAPTSELEKSEIVRRKIIYSEEGENKSALFLKEISEVANDCLIVGHYSRLKSHHPYFINVKELFNRNEGKTILKKLFAAVVQLEIQAGIDRNISDVQKLINRLNRLSEGFSIPSTELFKHNDFLIQTKEQFIKLMNDLQIQETNKIHSLNIDYILHASDSGFDIITKNDFDDFLNNGDIKLIRMPRISSNDEWAIPNIPIEYIHVFKDKKILILESATTTGETLLNLIDSMCYLQVKCIIVFSVISRLREDQEEFLTRIHKINNNQNLKPNVSIPIDVYFGAHYSLPQYLADSHECPHCKEEFEYKQILNDINTPKCVKDYLNTSLKLIEKINKNHQNNVEVVTMAKYLPLGLEKYKMFIIRDILGKKEKQKVRNKYFAKTTDNVNMFIEDEDNFNEVLGVLLHEPHLVHIVKEFFPETHKRIIEILDYRTVKFFKEMQKRDFNMLSNKLIETWKDQDLIFIYSFYFDDDYLYSRNNNQIKFDVTCNEEFLIKLFEFGNISTVHTLNFIAYVMWRNVKSAEYSKRKHIVDSYFYTLQKLKNNAFELDNEALKVVTIMTAEFSLERTSINSKSNNYIDYNNNIIKLIAQNSTDGNAHQNLSYIINDFARELVSTRSSKEELKLIWDNSISNKLLELHFNISKTIDVISKVDKSIYNFIKSNPIKHIVNLIELSFYDGSEPSDLKTISDKLKLLNTFYFLQNNRILELYTIRELNIIEMLKKSFDELEKKFGNQRITFKGNYSEMEFVFKGNELIFQKIIFDQLNENFLKYAKDYISVSVTHNQNSMELKFENAIKTNADYTTSDKSFHGKEIWDIILPNYEISHNHFSNHDQTIFTSIFNFQK